MAFLFFSSVRAVLNSFKRFSISIDASGGFHRDGR
jgi:hypothetical protein